jgi:hypothetical protein
VKAVRAAKDLGFISIQTFVLPTELGTSLKASGWNRIGVCKVGGWHTRNGRRHDQPEMPKVKWVKILSPSTPTCSQASPVPTSPELE